MEKKKNYILLKDLGVYRLARSLSRIAYEIYTTMKWQDKKILGDQFLQATDSIGANIAEGYHRYHYLDKIKFYYNARASLSESADHWFELMFERKLIAQNQYQQFMEKAKVLSLKLNNLISSNYRQKNKDEN